MQATATLSGRPSYLPIPSYDMDIGGMEEKSMDFSMWALPEQFAAMPEPPTAEYSILVGQEGPPTTLGDSRTRNVNFGSLVHICLYPLS